MLYRGCGEFAAGADGAKTIGCAEEMPLPSVTVTDWFGWISRTTSFFPLGQTISRLTVLPFSGLPSPKVIGSSLWDK